MRPIPLGTIAIAAHHSKGDRNALTGTLQIRATTVPEDLPRWRNEADRLLEHIRRVMSIAAASLLRSPITEFFAGEVNEVTALSQIAQGQAGLRAIRSQRQKEFFSAAVTSFFTPPIAAEQLFFAIEWFAMDVTYNEMRLVCAMTALENLIEANLAFEPVMQQGVLKGCSLLYAASTQDHAYQRGAVITVKGHITLLENTGNAIFAIKVGVEVGDIGIERGAPNSCESDLSKRDIADDKRML